MSKIHWNNDFCYFDHFSNLIFPVMKFPSSYRAQKFGYILLDFSEFMQILENGAFFAVERSHFRYSWSEKSKEWGTCFSISTSYKNLRSRSEISLPDLDRDVMECS